MFGFNFFGGGGKKKKNQSVFGNFGGGGLMPPFLGNNDGSDNRNSNPAAVQSNVNQFSTNRPIAQPGDVPDFNFNLSGRPTGKHQRRAFNTTLGSAQATQRTLPGLLNTFYSGLAQTAPILAQGQLDVLRNFGVPMAEAQAQAEKAGRLGTAQSDFDILSTVGRQLTGELAAQDRSINPEFYAGREATVGRGLDLLKGLDPNKLTEAEIANVERTQNRNNIGRGVANSGSNISAISNALGFDDRLQAKRGQLNNVLSSFGSILPGLRTEFNPALAMGRGGADLSALSSILPGQGIGTAQGIHAGNQGIFGPAYATAKSSYDSRVKPLERTLGALNSASSTLGNLGSAFAGFAASDRKLKQNIKLVSDGEIPIYEFTYKDDPTNIRYRGAMADDVEKVAPEAVGISAKGYKFVNYNHPELWKRNIRFEQLEA